MSIGRHDFVNDRARWARRSGKVPHRIGLDHPKKDFLCVQDFGRRHDLSRSEVNRLLQLFGASATAAELLANARGPSRVR